MELFSILLASLMTVVSPGGLVIEQTLTKEIQRAFPGTESVAVRLDNRPSFQIVQGKAQRVRIALGGLRVMDVLRLDTLDLETDPIDVDWRSLSQQGGGGIEQLRRSLRQPLDVGIHLVLTEADLQAALSSPQVQTMAQDLMQKVLGNMASGNVTYHLEELKVDFLGNNRLRVAGTITSHETDDNTTSLNATLEVGVQMVSSDRLRLVSPQVSINNEPLPPFLITNLLEGINRQLSIASIAPPGITPRLLNFTIDQDRLDLAAFVKVDPARP